MSSDMSNSSRVIFLLLLGTWQVVAQSSTDLVGLGFGPDTVNNSDKYAPASSLHFDNRGLDVLQTNPSLSSPESCFRVCRDGAPPKTCYYHFTAELYTVLGAACQVCTPNATNTVSGQCQCVLADGVERGLLTINRMLPGPSIQVCEGDKVVIDLRNQMQGLDLSIHWHGIHQRRTQFYDGVPFVTQCPVLEGNTFRYQWTATEPGTHFWYAQSGLQKMDGIYGSLIIRQPPNKDPYSTLYDYDLTTHVILLSDWMHEYDMERFPGRLAANTGQDPETILINGKGQFKDSNTGLTTNTSLETFTINPGRRYRFRLINSFSTVCPAQLTIQGHSLLVIATDGNPVRLVTVNTIISFAGERYDFVINANQPIGAYWIQVRGLGDCGIKRVQQLGVLRYTGGPQPKDQAPTYDAALPHGVVLNPLDAICNQPRNDAICVNQLKGFDQSRISGAADFKYFMSFSFLIYTPEELFQPNQYSGYLVTRTGDHIISLFNEISYVSPPSPPISQIYDIPPEQFCNIEHKPRNCGRNCMCTHKVEIPLNALVELILVDEVQQPNMSYSFHLHGYSFYVVSIGRSPDSNMKINSTYVLNLDRRGLIPRQFDNPPLKDTIAVPNNGYVVIRFRADNPGESEICETHRFCNTGYDECLPTNQDLMRCQGYWLLHSQSLFHRVVGMSAILQVGAPNVLQPTPPKFPTCGDFLPPNSLLPA